MGDTGLLITHSFDSGSITPSEIMEAFVKNKLSINEGMFFENAVAQALVSSNHALYYSEFYIEKDDKHLYEVDFISSSGKKIVPIEVKSSLSSKHRSLDLFMEKYGSRVDSAYVVHGKDLRVDGKITYIPIYMTICL
jgi:predicted AAA+ superfamily ATPase